MESRILEPFGTRDHREKDLLIIVTAGNSRA